MYKCRSPIFGCFCQYCVHVFREKDACFSPGLTHKSHNSKYQRNAESTKLNIYSFIIIKFLGAFRSTFQADITIRKFRGIFIQGQNLPTGGWSGDGEPTLANFFMAHLEQTFPSSSDAPLQYFRYVYVDDIFCIFDPATSDHKCFLDIF